MKRHLQCAEQQASPSNLTKCCPCHEKWCASFIVVTYATSFTMREATGITLQPHQILRLPRKSTLQNQRKICRNSWIVNSNAGTIRAWSEHDPNMIRTWSEHESEHELVISYPPVRQAYFSRFGDAFCIVKITTFRAPAIYPNFTKYCACHEKWHSKITKYCACHAKWLSWLMSVTHDTSFTMRGATDLILQHHQMLRLPRKMTRIIYPRDIWNVIYNARRNRHHPPTSPNTAPATQNDSQWLIFVTYETSFTMRGATGITLQPHQILRLPRKSALQNLSEILRKRLKRQFQCGDDSSMIRTWSEHESEHELVISHPPVRRAYFSRFGDAFCIENYNISRSGYLSKFHQILRLPRKVTLQDHQILRLPRKMTLMIDVRHTWHVIYNARSNRSHPPTSPNAAPATQNDSHHLSSWHMKRYLQCAEEQASPANLTKYCACHAKWLSWLIFVTYETSFTMRGATGITLQPHQILRLPRKSALQNLSEILRKRLKRQFQCGDDSSMIRTWSEHESEHELVISHPPVRRAYFSRFGDAFCIENYNISRSGYLSKFHQILRLPRKVTLQDHQILRLPRKVTLRHHQMLHLPRKVTLRHHQILRLPRKVRLSLNCYWTELLRSCYWAVTKLLLNCYWTELLLNCHWTVTELWLNWPVTELLYWTVTQLSCYWTELLLNCYWYSTVTGLLLNCYWTDLLLDCYWTNQLLSCYWIVTFTALLLELLLYWTLCIFKSP